MIMNFALEFCNTLDKDKSIIFINRKIYHVVDSSSSVKTFKVKDFSKEKPSKFLFDSGLELTPQHQFTLFHMSNDLIIVQVSHEQLTCNYKL